MQLRDLERLVGEIDAGDLRAALRHALGEYAAAAADVEHVFAAQRGASVDVIQSQRIDIVQRLEIAGGVPPVMGEFAEFGDFSRDRR